MRTNAINVLTENWNEYNFQCDMKSTISLHDYVVTTAESDPSFFRWFFDDENLSDFECKDESEWQEFLNNLPITFGGGDLLGGVATFNADPFCIESDNLEDIVEAIDDNYIEILNGDELTNAQQKLNITDETRRCYRAGECLFSPFES